jgi:lipoate-protein ligase A
VGGGRKIGGFLISHAEGIYIVNAQIFVGRFDPERFMEVIWVPMEIKDKVVEPLCSVEESAGARPDFETVRAAVVASVEKEFKARLAEGRMTRDELFGYEKLRSQAFRK